MRDRLIELLGSAEKSIFGKIVHRERGRRALADYLLSEGVIVPPCKVGDKAYHLTGIDTRKELDTTDIFEGKVCSISKQEDALNNILHSLSTLYGVCYRRCNHTYRLGVNRFSPCYSWYPRDL